MAESGRTNRGRAAAEENRKALLAAAQAVFAEKGLDAPLSTVAKTAGVGQGSLYRHFPDRVELALSVFEANVAGLEEMAADDNTDLDDLIEYLTEKSIDSVAFVDVMSSAADDRRLSRLVERVFACLSVKVEGAHRAETMRSSMDENDVLMAVGMVANLLTRTPAGERRETADAAWSLMRQGLSPVGDPPESRGR